MKKMQVSLLAYFIGIMIITVGMALVLLHHKENEIATVDVNGIIKHYTQIISKSNDDSTTIEKNTKLFIKQLEEEIHHLAKKKKVTLLVSEAVLTGATDYTDLIQKRINHYQINLDSRNRRPD